MNDENEVVVNLEPILRKTVEGTPVKLVEELPALPIEHCILSVIVHPDTDKEFKGLVRGDALIPPWIPTRAATKKVSDIVYKLHVDTPEELAAIEKARQDMALNNPERFEKMEHARKHREVSLEYKDVAREVVCVGCGKKQPIAPANVLKRAKAKGVSHQEWTAQFKCQECAPTPRGRPINPKYALMPRELKCSEPNCGFIQKVSPSGLEKAAMVSGKPFNQYVREWKCKLHREHREHHFSKAARLARGDKPKETTVATETSHHRGRVADPRWNGMAKQLVCHYSGCSKVQPQHPSLTLAAAERQGLSFDEFVQGWKCRIHRK